MGGREGGNICIIKADLPCYGTNQYKESDTTVTEQQKGYVYSQV